MRIYHMKLVIMVLLFLLATTVAKDPSKKIKKKCSKLVVKGVNFQDLKKYRFKHLIGTSNSHGTERDCLLQLKLNQKFTKNEEVTSINAKKGENEEIICTKGKGIKRKFLKVHKCPQHGSTNKKTDNKSVMTRYSTSKKKFVANWVGAHVRIQEWKGATPHGNAHFNDCDEELEGTDQHGCKSWITIGNFVIPTAKDPNSQAGRKLKKKVNKNPWERLDQTVAGIPIKLKKWQQQKC